MTPKINKDRISISITNQLEIQNLILISKINDIVKNSIIINYDDIKELSMSIKECLKNNNIEIQHSKVLNIISKALGYQNHHSLKSNLTNMIDDSKYSIKIDVENDSTLKKLFLLKNDFIDKFNIETWKISAFISKEHQFNFSYDKRDIELGSKEKIEINKYLKSYAIKQSGKVISLFKVKNANLHKVAFNILQHYQSFFEPIWYERNSRLDNYSLLVNDWSVLSYSSIDYKDNCFLIVDSYSTDLYWHIVVNFLDYIFRFGTLEDIEFFEQCLKEKDFSKFKRTTKTLGELRRIHDWEKQQILKEMVKNKGKSIKETLQYSKFQINIPPYVHPYIKEFEVQNNKSIKNIIIENCDYFSKLDKNNKKENIEEKLHIDFYSTTKKQNIENMEKIDVIELYRTHNDRFNSIKILSSKIKYLIDIFKDAEK